MPLASYTDNSSALKLSVRVMVLQCTTAQKLRAQQILKAFPGSDFRD